MPYRIGIDLRFWRRETGGLSRYSRNLLTEILDLGSENQYVAIITPEDKPEFDLVRPNLSVLVVDCPYYSLAEQRRLPKILADQKLDLVHFTHFSHPIAYKGRFVTTIHDLIMSLYPSGKLKRSKLRKAAYNVVMRHNRKASRVLVPSLSTKQDLISYLDFKENLITVTPEGSAQGFRVHTAAEIKAVKQKLQLPDRFVLFVSRWEKYKGLDTLISAFEIASKKVLGLGLVITGKPSAQSPEIAELVRQKQQDGLAIATPGFVEDQDLAALYSAASVYVHPSWYEGFGIMILEAFASGVPVITSNVSSLPEVTGDAGILVDPQNSTELSAALVDILEHPEKAAELKAKGLKRVQEYSWNSMAKQTHAAYLEVITQKPRTLTGK